MMTAIFCVMLLGGIVFGALTGRMPQVSDALLKESGRAIELILSLAGNFCLWGGIMRIAEDSKLTNALAHLSSPITCRLFKGLRPQGKAMRAISMNMVANLLGLGNAATPLGITAMKAMEEEERANGTATDNMVLFVAMNTASLQLLPTTTAMLRSAAGSKTPLDILPAVWVASTVSVLSGILAAKVLSNRRKRS